MSDDLVARRLAPRAPSIQIDALSKVEPIFEVQMLNAIGGQGRYRVSANPPGRLIFESFGKGVALPEVNTASGERWITVQSVQTRSTLTSLGHSAGLLSDEQVEGLEYWTADAKRLDSALFVTPKLAPCGSCSDWNPIDATVCADCRKDPRAIVEPCGYCEGRGEAYSIPGGTLPCACPRCDGQKTVEASAGKARWAYLYRLRLAGIIEREQAHDAIIEEL